MVRLLLVLMFFLSSSSSSASFVTHHPSPLVPCSELKDVQPEHYSKTGVNFLDWDGEKAKRFIVVLPREDAKTGETVRWCWMPKHPPPFVPCSKFEHLKPEQYSILGLHFVELFEECGDRTTKMVIVLARDDERTGEPVHWCSMPDELQNVDVV